jgi:ABC-type Fe3+-hydroxamate transport system substrate-binding protein
MCRSDFAAALPRRAPAGGCFLAGLLCASMAACEGREEPAQPSELFSAPPAELRVVSLSPAASRFVVALGAAWTLVGVDSESGRLPELGPLPVVELEDAAALAPDLVLVPALRAEDTGSVERLRARGSEVIAVSPQDYDEVFALCRDLGARLAGPMRAAALEVELGRELALLAAESRGLRRPRVAAVRGVEPLELAPAHSFETDLIELAGGTSASHDHTLLRRPASPTELMASAPDLVLVVSAAPLPDPARAAARRVLGDALPVAFFALDQQLFWVRDGGDAVRRLRALIEPLR